MPQFVQFTLVMPWTEISRDRFVVRDILYLLFSSLNILGVRMSCQWLVAYFQVNQSVVIRFGTKSRESLLEGAKTTNNKQNNRNEKWKSKFIIFFSVRDLSASPQMNSVDEMLEKDISTVDSITTEIFMGISSSGCFHRISTACH